MRRLELAPASVDAVLVSHLHGDHFGGLPFLILDAQFGHRQRPLLVAGPPGTRDRVLQAMEVLFPGSSQTDQHFPMTFVELLAGSTTDLGTLSVVPYEVRHASGAPAYALQVTCDGKVIAYSGDTEWTEALLEAARGADLFICEAYFFERKIRYHLDYQTLAQHRSEFACRRLVVTHMSIDIRGRVPEMDVEFAEDGKELVL